MNRFAATGATLLVCLGVGAQAQTPPAASRPLATGSQISYDNDTSGLAADNVQEALDEVVNEMVSTSTRAADFDGCRAGARGFNLDSSTGLYATTCGNFDWHGAAGMTEDGALASASYDVTCTGRGTPNRACPYNGAVIHVNYPIHRTAVASMKTQRNGKVLLPLDAGRDYALYVDQGAGCLSTGAITPTLGATGSDCTGGTSFNARYPIATAWWLRDIFPEGYAETGAPVELRSLQVLNGVAIEGEVPCKVEYVDSADCPVAPGSAESRLLCVEPRYTGVCILNDRGAATINTSNLATRYLDGASATNTQPDFTNMGGSPGSSHCVPTSNSDWSCNMSGMGWPGGIVTYDHQSSFLTVPGTITQINADSPYEVCVDNNYAANADTFATNGSAACAKAPWVQCENNTDNLYSAGGCIVDEDSSGTVTVGDTNLGPCLGQVDLAEYLFEDRDLDLIASINVPNCVEPVTGAGDCPATAGLRNVWVTPAAIDTGASCPAGSKSITFGVAGGVVTGGGMPITRAFSGSAGSMTIEWTTRALADQGDGGFRKVGLVPAHQLSQWSPSEITSGLANGASAGAQTINVDTVTGTALGTNSHKGLTLTLSPGTSNACFRTISSNTATSLTWTGGNCVWADDATWEITPYACLSSGYGGSPSAPWTAAQDESACDTESIFAYYQAILRGGGLSDSFIGCNNLSKSCLDTYAQGTTYQRNRIDLYRSSAFDPAGTATRIIDNVIDGARSRVFTNVLTGFGQYTVFARNLVQNLYGVVWNTGFNIESFTFAENTVRNVNSGGNMMFMILGGQSLNIRDNVFQGTHNGILLRPSNFRISNVLIENNTWDHASTDYGLISLDDSTYALNNITIRNENVNTTRSTGSCFITADPGIGSDLNTHEYSGNSIVGRSGGHRAVCYDAGISVNVSDSDAYDTLTYPPHTARNMSNGVLEFGWSATVRTASGWGDADSLPAGTYYIADDDGTCTDTGSDGTLDGGDTPTNGPAACVWDGASPGWTAL